MQHEPRRVQQELATAERLSQLKARAQNVLARNVGVRHIRDSRPENVLPNAATPAGALQHENCESGPLPHFGRVSGGRHQLVLTLEDLPEMERRLRLSGWHVERRGNELVCTSPRAQVR